MSLAAFTLRLLGLRRPDGAVATATSVLLFAVAAALALCWVFPWAGPLLFFAIVGAIAAAAYLVNYRLAMLRALAWAIVLLVQLFWFCLAGALAVMLGWSVAPSLWWADAGLAALALASAARPRARIRVPIALPVGIAIALLLAGWMREESIIRCDDYLRVRSSGLAVLVPSSPELEHCVPGGFVMVRRYPRGFWEHPDGKHFVVTTQRSEHEATFAVPTGQHVSEWFGGAICHVEVGSSERPPCFDDGKAQDIGESPLRARLYVPAHDGQEGRVYVLPRDGPFRPLAEAHLPGKVGAGVYVDDEHDSVGLFEDKGLLLYRFRASDLTPSPPVPAPFLPDAVHYDPSSHQGIACAALGPLRRIDGQAFASVAFDGALLRYRPLAPSFQYPSSWLALTWGCDWDRAARRVYVAVASLGLLEEIDYDTGRILRRFHVGFGVRSLVLDTLRRRLYAGFFLSGDIVAVDVDSGAVVDRWSVGRFVRRVALSRERTALLAASNLGIVRIPLQSVAAESAAAGTPDFGQLGQPRPDLTPDELAAFNAGKQLFIKKLPKVGPLYDAESCAECHFIPTLGGGGDAEHALYVRPGDPGGMEIAFYHKRAMPGWTIPARPANANRRLPVPLYGLGLVEKIPDETIRAACGTGHSDPAKLQGFLPHNTIARFGAKPFVGTVLDIVGSELWAESSVTNPIEGTPDDDNLPDPEVDAKFVETLAAFVRGLAPPGRNGADAAGEAAFQSFGCAGCHVPDMPPAKGVFSDFCVHSMGKAFDDGIVDHTAQGDEFRTTPLWGLRFRKLYLHDGRATSLDGAISAHGGEAQTSVSNYKNATPEQRAALLRFLQTL